MSGFLQLPKLNNFNTINETYHGFWIGLEFPDSVDGVLSIIQFAFIYETFTVFLLLFFINNCKCFIICCSFCFKNKDMQVNA
ncbi:hypothetical protein QFZ77_004736 [Paenibacillus sp. V4I3]|nr:hypothetical protein [Paenibacillus sp. V4I3]MDQ0887974.1 hypothetical protein [Paenibacillus sp. V4I9]